MSCTQSPSCDLHSLFVGNLPENCKHQELVDIFRPFGEMTVRIKYARTTCHPLGYCFVDFKNRVHAENALKGTQSFVLRDRTLQVRDGMRNKELHVRGFAKSANWTEEVLPLFAKHGPLLLDQCNLTQTSKPCNYGTVAFCSRSDAERARDFIDGMWFQGHQLSVKWKQQLNFAYNIGTDQTDRANTTSASCTPVKTIGTAGTVVTASPSSAVVSPAAGGFAAGSPAAPGAGRSALKDCTAYTEHPHFSVHISFQTTRINVKVTEKMIFRAFSFGGPNKMATISIKKKVYDKNHMCSGFAFIHFNDMQSARTAVQRGKNLVAEGCHFRADFSKHMQRRGVLLQSELEDTVLLGDKTARQQESIYSQKHAVPAVFPTAFTQEHDVGVPIAPAITLDPRLAFSIQHMPVVVPYSFNFVQTPGRGVILTQPGPVPLYFTSTSTVIYHQQQRGAMA